MRGEGKNHPSATPGNAHYDAVKSQVLNEISEGNYVLTDDKPVLISPLGAVSKSDGSVRLIHDCSRPTGNCVNDYASLNESQQFQTIDDATSLLQQGYFMAKVDLKSAYRSVRISTDSQRFTGLQLSLDGHNVYMYDTKLPFGSRFSPGVFHRLTQCVKRLLEKRGFTAVVYLDDFFLCAPTLDECALAMSTLIELLRSLGFRINWKKVVDPTQQLVFLGIEINSVTMSKRLPDDKLAALKNTICDFSKKKRASKKQLQSLAGKLNWAAGVVYGGRVFIRRIIDAICKLAAANHKCILSREVRADIEWWETFMSSFNGTALILDDMPITSVCTDACNIAAGGYYGGGETSLPDWFHCNWACDWPELQEAHINVKELASVVLAAHRWAAAWANKRVIIWSDNSTTVSCINRGSSRNCYLMRYLRYMFWLSATYNFRISARHVPGIDNVIADRISRLHEPSARYELFELLVASPLEWHMSLKSYMYVVNRTGHSSPTVPELIG